jgi:fructose/tagatose bisphosphate aldolase
MLALPSLELARAKRHHKPIISCRTNSLQIATAAIQAGIVEKAPVFITIDATKVTTLPHQALLAGILEFGRFVPITVVVEVVVGTGKQAASWWISQGALAVTVQGSKDAIKRNLESITAEAFAHGVEIGLEPTDVTTPADIAQFVRRNDASYIRLAPLEHLLQMRELVKKTKELIGAGCAGLTLENELDEAFTAGLRTALRSRTLTDPATYLTYGATAVRECVRAHYNYFHNTK